MKRLAIGLMSGTSADGCSGAVAAFSERGVECLAHHTISYSQSLRKRILQGAQASAVELSRLNFELGALFAECAVSLMKKNRLRPEQISVIGSHGQTIYHGPEDAPPNTLQIGEASIVAEKTGIPVVCDFRPRDIAAGGQGAPLLPFFDRFVFGAGPVRALQNIGGIGNVAIVGSAVKRPLAFDTGPGNCLIDWAVREATGGKKIFDRGGEWAARGNPDVDLVRKMIEHSYFRKSPPKSTGPELFNPSFLPEPLKRMLRARSVDALRTLTFFTAYSIAEGYRRFIYPKYRVEEVVVSGGGAFNRTLMQDLADCLSPISVFPIERLGIPVQAKEPIAFAYFALRAIDGEFNHDPEGTGAAGPRVLGKIIPGKKFGGVR